MANVEVVFAKVVGSNQWMGILTTFYTIIQYFKVNFGDISFVQSFYHLTFTTAMTI